MRGGVLKGTALLALVAFPADSGPWPRGSGEVFASVSSEITADPETLLLVYPEYDLSFYGEFGIGDRLTGVLDAYGGPRIRTAIGSLRYTLTRPEARHQIGVSLGLGSSWQPDGMESEALGVAGLSWGMAFDTGWGGAWATVEGQYRAGAQLSEEWKIDATLGLRPGERWLAYGQLQSSGLGEGETSVRLQASGVLELTDWLSVETGVVTGLSNYERIGMKIGLWTSF